MRKLNRREKLLTYVVLSIAFIFLSERSFISPLYKKLKEFPQKIKQEEIKLKSALLTRKKKDKILEELYIYKKYLVKVSTPQEVMGEFLKEIERLAKEANISVVSLNPRDLTGKKYVANLRAEAKIENILKFLYNTQNSNLLIKIESFSLARRGKEKEKLHLDATLVRTIP
jgi:hypothetical protein